MENTIIDLKEKIEEHKRRIERKTISVKEFAEVMGCSYQKALTLVHHRNCPCIKVGHGYRIIISKIDDFLEELIGYEL